MTNGNGNHKMGHPPLKLDWELIDKLCQIQCTEDEIAFVCHCHVDSLRNHAIRTQGMTWQDYLESHRHGGKASLRRKQFETALDGNVTMLIWLGKQYLGQTDKVESKEDVQVTLSASDLTDDQLAAIATGRGAGVAAPAVGPLSSN